MIRAVGILAVILALSFLCWGQQNFGRQRSQVRLIGQAAPASSQENTNGQELGKLNARTDLVLVPVIVTDKAGNHVSGLGKDAFRIEEDDKFREISVLEEVKTENPFPRVPTSAAEAHSNFPLGSDHPWRITIVGLDLVNSPLRLSFHH